jgi:hypothetical protein
MNCGLWSCFAAIVVATIIYVGFNVFDWFSLKKLLHKHEQRSQQHREELYAALGEVRQLANSHHANAYKKNDRVWIKTLKRHGTIRRADFSLFLQVDGEDERYRYMCGSEDVSKLEGSDGT